MLSSQKKDESIHYRHKLKQTDKNRQTVPSIYNKEEL